MSISHAFGLDPFPYRTRAGGRAQSVFQIADIQKEFSMSIFIRILMRAGPLAGIGAITLGLLHWFFRISFIEIHILFGLLVTLALLIAGIVAVFTRGLRVLGAIAIVFALIVPVFGMTQMRILVGDFHWLIQVAHLLVGAAAVSLTERIGSCAS
jgi:hypothetical protein